MKLIKILTRICLPIILGCLSLEYIYLRIFSANVFNNLDVRLEQGQHPAHLLSYQYGHLAVICFVLYMIVLIVVSCNNKKNLASQH